MPGRRRSRARRRRSEAFRAAYPARLAFEYRLDGDAADRPFLVEAMWHDGQFTYLRSRAQESPALYELPGRRTGARRLRPDGGRPLPSPATCWADGWLQIGDKRVSWRFTPRDGLR